MDLSIFLLIIPFVILVLIGANAKRRRKRAPASDKEAG